MLGNCKRVTFINIHIIEHPAQKHESHSFGFQIMPFTENALALISKHVLSDTCHTCHGKIVQYYERIVVLKHISGNLLLQRVHP